MVKVSKTAIPALFAVSFLIAPAPKHGLYHWVRLLISISLAYWKQEQTPTNWAPTLLENMDFMGIQYIFTSLTKDVKSMKFWDELLL